MDTTRRIITPSNDTVQDIQSSAAGEGEELTRQQKRLLERQQQDEQEKRIRFLKSPARMAHVMELSSTIMNVANSINETDISFMAFVELLEEKDILTKEDVMEKEQEVFERLNKKQETPNSPALEESRENAKGDVQRLTEVPVEDEAPRRLVEGG